MNFLSSQVYSKPLIRKTRDADANPAEEAAKAPEAEAKEPVAEAKAPVAEKEATKTKAKQTEAESKATEGKQEETTVEQTVIIDPLGRFMIALSRLIVGTNEIDLTTATAEFNTTSDTIMNAALVAGTTHIGITIELSGGTWRANAFSYNGDLRFKSTVPVSAYDRKSFGCGDLHLFEITTATEITLENVQIQPLFQPAAGEVLTAFSDHHNDCVGFFSPAIWGALFVVILLMSIMSCGITFILDIKTNDRFDDPKGKTITISAQE